jgi:hypothetical protein
MTEILTEAGFDDVGVLKVLRVLSYYVTGAMLRKPAAGSLRADAAVFGEGLDIVLSGIHHALNAV